jgi:sugar phosphate permease
MNPASHLPNQPVFASRRIFLNFVLITLCSQFMFALLAMKGVLLPQILELWDVSKTQFGLLLSIYGLASNFMYVALSWAQDRFAPQKLIAIPMIIGGITTFFLGKTSDFNVLLGLLLVLAICCEGAFWPAILSSVRKSTSDDQQSKVFGFLEGGRGLIEFLQNAITLGLYALLGYSVLGLEVAFMINGGVMVALGIASWFTLPDKPLLKSGDSSGTMMQEVREGMKLTLSMPEIWLTGLVGFFVYFAYTSLPFYVTYLNESFTLPAIAASIFALFSTSAGRIGSAFVASFVTNRVFGGAVGGMRAGPHGRSGVGGSARSTSELAGFCLDCNGIARTTLFYDFLHACSVFRSLWRNGATTAFFRLCDCGRLIRCICTLLFRLPLFRRHF